ncbi:phospholipid carrier-dependent glycosyltransferase [Dactylosporangium sp. NPDC050688]|uniref:phospholipid carrier-dependent glycosyltransferase n=1 Tax=Dactylosporangium sp. NPDC050688 TaxID=3157217 RepID=UPI0033E5AFCA
MWLREHRMLAGLVAIGATIRLGMMFAYYPAFGYFYDTRGYLDAASSTTPGTIWPFGYSAMLKVLDAVTGQIVSVSAVQHLMGLALGVAVYALLTRRDVRRSWAALAAAPVLLDARQIQLEHYVLSETLFTFLLLAGVTLLMWAQRPPLWLTACAGAVIALAALTRTVGQPLAVLIIGYLIVRRVGWRHVAVFTVAVTVPMGGYLVWYHRHHGEYAFNGYSGRYLWQRTTTFVDCSRTDFTPREREICPPEPLGRREVSDIYFWGLDRDRIGQRYPGPGHDALFAGFARKAVLGQPGDFLAAVTTDIWHLVQPGWPAPQRIACTTDMWTMPSGGRSGNQVSACTAILMVTGFRPVGSGPAAPAATPLNSSLWAYGQTFVTPPSVLLLGALLALLLAAWSRRPAGRWPGGGRAAADAALLATMSLAMLLLGVALSVIDLRFTVPLLTTVPPALALAATTLRRRPALREEPAAAPPGRTPDGPAGGAGAPDGPVATVIARQKGKSVVRQ